MSDPNHQGYSGEEHFYQNRDKAGTFMPPPTPPRRPRGGLLPILFAVIGALLIVVIIMGVVVAHLATASQAGTSNQQGSAIASAPTAVPTTAPPQTAPTSAPAIPTPTPTPAATLPCNVDLNTWTGGSADWKVLNGMLLNDGTNDNGGNMNGPTLVAPCQLGNVTDYAVTAKMQVTGGQYGQCFGISVRGTTDPNGWQGYLRWSWGLLSIGSKYSIPWRARLCEQF